MEMVPARFNRSQTSKFTPITVKEGGARAELLRKRLNDNSSQATISPICKKRQFAPNCLIDQLINNFLEIEIKRVNK